MKFIAEFCQNHLGRVDLLADMIRAASSAGATHAKIQALYSDELTFRNEFEDINGRLYRPFEAEKRRLRELDLSEETEKWFVQTCNDSGIIPMITVFTHYGIERAESAGFKSIKIASYDCASHPLIERVAIFAEEIVVSTGATTWDEIISTTDLLKSIRSRVDVSVLHARTIYPTPLNEVHLARMLALTSLSLPVGYSDHTLTIDGDLRASHVACYFGASAVERHFTILPKDETKDGKVSINAEELMELVQFSKLNKADQLEVLGLNLISQCFGVPLLLSEEEELNRAYYRGRVGTHGEGKVIFGWEEWE